MTWLESINGGRPLQAGDWAVLAIHGGTYVLSIAYITYRLLKGKPKL